MNWIKKLMIVIISTLVAIKGSDILIGYFHPENSFPVESRGVERYVDLRENNPNFKAEYVPSKKYLNKTDSLERKKYLVRTDEDGFIENGNNLNFTKNYETIIFFGGSTTEQAFVKEEYRWQSILERNLNDQKVPKFKVINAGVSGNHSIHSTINLIAKGIPLKPKYVVLMHNVNDYALLRFTGSYWNSPPSKAILQIKDDISLIPLLRRIKDNFIPNLYMIYTTVKYRFSDHDDFSTIRDNELVSQHIIDESFRKSLNTFIDICFAWDIEPVLMTQFNRINSEDKLFIKNKGKNTKQYIKGYKRLNDVIRQVSVSRKVDLIDLDKLVPGTKDYIYDAVHLNDNGSKLVAGILFDYWRKKIVSFD
tara:strand:- start:53 stop:1147 length:1095 start_codon:yes stop_codon:yes gene_type:complete